MKKFFKGLALVLALTLIIGTVPAFAATELTVAKTKVLYLGGSTGTTADGKKCATGETKQMKNMVKGFDNDTMKLSVSSDDEEIVEVIKSTTIKAVKMGTAKVNYVVSDKATNEVLKFGSVDVTVKKNATKDTIKVTGIEEGATVKVSDVLDVTMPRAGVYTDVAMIACEGAKIEAGASARTWKVSFEKAGEYTLKAYTYQSKDYTGETASKEIKFTVTGAQLTGAKQLSAKTFNMEFDSVKDVTLTKNDVVAYTKNALGIKVYNCAIEKVEKTDAGVTVTAYNAFTKNTEYFVEFGGKSASFVGADISEGAIASFVINQTAAVKDSVTNLSVTCYDANGIKLDGVAPSYLTYEQVAADENCFVSGNTIYLAKAGDQVTVNAYAIFYSDDITKEDTKLYAVAPVTFTAVNAAARTGAETVIVSANTITSRFDTKVSKICVGDTPFFDIFYEEQPAIGGDKQYKQATTNLGYTFSSSNEKIFVMSGNQIIPVAKGEAYILVYAPNSDGSKSVVESQLITIDEARKAARYTVTPSKSKVNVCATAKDAMKLTITVYDQYNEKFNVAAATSFNLKTIANGSKLVFDQNVTVAAGSNHVDFEVVKADGSLGTGVTESLANKGIIAVNVEASNNNLGKVRAAFNAGKFIEGSDNVSASRYALNNVPAAPIEVAVTTETKAEKLNALKFTVDIDKMYNEFKLADATGVTQVNAVPQSSTATGDAETYSYVVLDKNNAVVQASNDLVTGGFITYNAGSIDVVPVVYAAGTEIQQMAAGKYTVNVYKTKVTSTSTIVTTIATASFTIVNNQIKAAATRKVGSYNNSGVGINNTAAFEACFETKINGKDIVGITQCTSQQDTTNAFVYTAAKAKFNTVDAGFLIVDVTGLPEVIKSNN